MRPRLLPLLLLLVLAGCGTEKSTGSGGGGGSPSEPSSASAGNTVQVKMKDILFVPDRITARVGQTVHWSNQDSFAHTVTARKGADFDSGPVAPGKTYSVKVTKPGTIEYVCTIHPNQRGTITVDR